jgi:hypothetical protein
MLKDAIKKKNQLKKPHKKPHKSIEQTHDSSHKTRINLYKANKKNYEV